MPILETRKLTVPNTAKPNRPQTIQEGKKKIKFEKLGKIKRTALTPMEGLDENHKQPWILRSSTTCDSPSLQRKRRGEICLQMVASSLSDEECGISEKGEGREGVGILHRKAE
ncbi:Hypothetical predicted protein [Pelobates cultripes]|uniref:Uncharacterized protein n=1 Tax=Pelobates cultripes TaxID=61616 RepID=A0AAD1S1C3_PELCU|nr:Hypothetical predicted protein [Pelobates cultripes]